MDCDVMYICSVLLCDMLKFVHAPRLLNLKRGRYGSYTTSFSQVAVGVGNGKIRIRNADARDVPFIRCCNNVCLPEKYEDWAIKQHIKHWPGLVLVAEKTVERTLLTSTHTDDEAKYNAFVEKQLKLYGDTDNVCADSADYELVGYVMGRLCTLHEVSKLGTTETESFYANTASEEPPVLPHQRKKNSQRIEYDRNTIVGFINSIAVYHDYRNQGIAGLLMKEVNAIMSGICLNPTIRGSTAPEISYNYNPIHYTFGDIVDSSNEKNEKAIRSVFLHVRAVTNESAVSFYKKKLDFEHYQLLYGHYADKEDALLLRKSLLK